VTWRAFETDEPEMARFASEQFERSGMALIGTIRSDGSPRISSVQPCILDGELYLGMMWESRKALDLLRDPRLVVRNAICSNTGAECELSLRGRAIDVRDAEVRRRFVEAVSEVTTWKEPHFHLFSIDVESAAFLEYGDGQQSVTLWPQGTSSTRPYE
jgi:hypothetical protein